MSVVLAAIIKDAAVRRERRERGIYVTEVVRSEVSTNYLGDRNVILVNHERILPS